MDNLSIAFNSVAPMGLLMTVGYIIRRLGFINELTLSQMNRTLFYVFLPALTFKSVYAGDIFTASSLSLALFCVAGDVLLYFVSDRLVNLIDPARSRHAVLMQCFFRASTLIIGIPIASSLFKDISVMVVVFATMVPTFNILAVLAHEQDAGSLGKRFLATLKNPLIVSIAVGLLLNAANVRLPAVVTGVIGTMATIGSGMSLVLLGVSFHFGGTRQNSRVVLLADAARLLIVPAFFVGVALLLGFRKIELLSVLIVFGSSVPVTTFTMAKEYNCDAELASEIVLTSTMVSCLTLFLWIYFFKTFQLL